MVPTLKRRGMFPAAPPVLYGAFGGAFTSGAQAAIAALPCPQPIVILDR